MISFLKKCVIKNDIIWEGSLPGSGRGNLGGGAQETKVNSFLKKVVNNMIRFWEGGLLDLEGEIWGEESRQQK